MKKALFYVTVLCLLFACSACRITDAPPIDTSDSDVVDSTVSDNENPPAHEHTAVTDEGYAATCTSTGLTNGSHCSVCGEILTAQAPIPATGHTPVVDRAVEATNTATGLTEGSHCSVCGEILIAQTVIPKIEPVKIPFAGGTVTKEPTTIKTKHLELKIDANVYVPDNLSETLDIVTDIMEKVSGMKFEGNPHYADGLLLAGCISVGVDGIHILSKIFICQLKLNAALQDKTATHVEIAPNLVITHLRCN